MSFLFNYSLRTIIMPFYGVRAGRVIGVYSTWDECQLQINGFPKAQFKKFSTLGEAQAYVKSEQLPSYATNSSKNTTISKSSDKLHRLPSALKSNIGSDSLVNAWMQMATRKQQKPSLKEQDGFQSITATDPTALHKTAAWNAGQTVGIKRSYHTLLASERSFNTHSRSEDISALLFHEYVSIPNKEAHETMMRRLMAEGNVHVVYADGSSCGNGRVHAHAGVGVYFGESDPRNISEPLGGERQTNQRAELFACIRALEKTAGNEGILEIRTDSRYVIKAMTDWIWNWKKNGWKSATGGGVLNDDLFKRLEELSESRDYRINWVHVAGHIGEPGNTQADILARNGAKMNLIETQQAKSG